MQQNQKQRGHTRRNGKQLSSTVLNLDFSDLARTIVNDTVNLPFNMHFTKQKVLWSWAKIGLVPFLRSCMNNRKVRKELGQKKADEALEDFKLWYKVVVDSIEGDRLTLESSTLSFQQPYMSRDPRLTQSR